MTDREKIADMVNGYFGCDAAYFDVDPFELADHLISNGVVVREKGEWVDVPYVYFGAKRYMCSQCSDDEFWNMRIVTTRDDFCPNCGADMRADEQNRAREVENDG